MKIFKIAALGIVAVSLSACETPHEPLAKTMGDAVAQNMAVQIINPQGSHVDIVPGNDGERVMRAHDRLVTEKKEQETVRFPAFIIQQNGAK